MRGNQCLLAHNVRFAEGLYSALAGFVEAGESAEQALIREIREETGIEACDLEYVGSQPWLVKTVSWKLPDLSAALGTKATP